LLAEELPKTQNLSKSRPHQTFEIRSFSGTRSFILPIMMNEGMLAKMAKDPPSKAITITR
jgi:hypothetical protein